MSESLRPGVHRFALIAILGIQCAFDAMSIDLYLPAFPAIAYAIGADAAGMQTSLSVFLIGLAFGQILYGPFTDRYGRKVPLLLGIALFLAASICLSHAASLTEFVFFRLLQGIGGAAGLVIPRAIVADLYAEREAAKVFSLLMQVMAIAPIVAPPLGNLLSGTLGWQAIFWGLGSVGAIMLFATWRWVPESLPRGQRMQGNIGSAFVGYTALFRQRIYMGYTLSGAFTMGSAAGQTGVASSLLGVMQYLFGGVVGVLLGVVHDGTLLPPLLMLAVCALAALLCWRDAHRQQAGKHTALSSTASDISH